MKVVINAKDKNCPIPVILAKKEIDKNHSDFMIEVDNDIAVENLKKLAKNQEYGLRIEENNGAYQLFFMSGKRSESDSDLKVENLNTPLNEMRKLDNPSWVVFMGKDYIGEGDYELGNSLVKMFFYTLTQSEDVPESILLMNSGVKLTTINEQVVEHLKCLEERGVNIIVCGTCLDYYQMKDQLKVGEISNMYDITEKMFSASKVITL